MGKKVNSYWRTAAIVLGILFVLMLVIMGYGSKIVAAEDKCLNYCYVNDYESFTYDYSADECDCYIGTEIIEAVRIRG